MPEEFERRRFHSENVSDGFRPHYATITGRFGFVFEEKNDQGNHIIIYAIVFEKLRFENVFRPHERRRADVFKFLGFEERF